MTIVAPLDWMKHIVSFLFMSFSPVFQDHGIIKAVNSSICPLAIVHSRVFRVMVNTVRSMKLTDNSRGFSYSINNFSIPREYSF